MLIALHATVLEENVSGIGNFRSGIEGSGDIGEGEETGIWVTFAEVDECGTVWLLPEGGHGAQMGVMGEKRTEGQSGKEAEHVGRHALAELALELGGGGISNDDWRDS